MSQLDEIHELFGSIAFPETPEERDDAERKILALVREQAAKLEAVRELHDFHFQGDAKKCDTCQVSGYALPWPCETVDALEASA